MGRRSAGLVQQLVGGAPSGKAPPSLEAGVKFGGSATSLSYQLDNLEDATPSAVQLSFDPAYLEAELDTQDDGVVATPCYVIEPGGSRSVTLVRSESCPTSGGPFIVTVSATLASGATVEQTITVEPAATLLGVLGAFSPTRLYLMTSNGSGGVEDLGSAGDDATLTGVTIATSDNVGWSGEATIDGFNDRVHVNLPRLGDNGCSYDRDRTWVVVWKSVGATAARNFMGQTAVLRLRQSGTGIIIYYNGGANFTAGTGDSHTDGGSSEALSNTTGTILMVAYVYDATAEEWTIRWKSSGHRAGHSFKVIGSSPPDSTSGTLNWRVAGWDANSAGFHIAGAHAIINSKITAADFDEIASTAGL